MKIQNAKTIQVFKTKDLIGTTLYHIRYSGLTIVTDDRDKAIQFCVSAKTWSNIDLNVFVSDDSDFINDLNFVLDYEKTDNLI